MPAKNLLCPVYRLVSGVWENYTNTTTDAFGTFVVSTSEPNLLIFVLSSSISADVFWTTNHQILGAQPSYHAWGIQIDNPSFKNLQVPDSLTLIRASPGAFHITTQGAYARVSTAPLSTG